MVGLLRCRLVGRTPAGCDASLLAACAAQDKRGMRESRGADPHRGLDWDPGRYLGRYLGRDPSKAPSALLLFAFVIAGIVGVVRFFVIALFGLAITEYQAIALGGIGL